MKFYKEKLPNGLTIVGERNTDVSSVAIGFFVKTGARDESEEVSGVSHFLEHMLFKGTETRSALDITYQMGEIGAQANAYTSEEATVYYMAVLPEYLKKAVDLLSDMLRPALRKSDFDMEKNVILEEIALYKDRPNYLLFESSLREFFGKHKAGNSVLGSTKSISDLTSEQMKKYFDVRYAADNIVFCCSGNFEWEQIKDLVSKNCQSWQSSNTARDYQEFSPKQNFKTLEKAGINQAHLCYVFQGPSAQEEQRFEADILSNILGDSSGSKLYWELVDKGLADSASIGTDNMDKVGLIYAYVSCDPKNISKITSKIKKIFSDALDFNKEDLQRSLNKIRTRLVLQGESNMRRLMSVGNDLIFNEKYFSLEETQEKYLKVSENSIKELLSNFPLDNYTEVHLLPKK